MQKFLYPIPSKERFTNNKKMSDGRLLREPDEISNTNASKIQRFRNCLKLDEISGITINSIRSTNVMYVSSNTECTQFDVDFILALNLKVFMKIVYPRITLFSNEVVDISKLRILIGNDDVKHELISCTNYLQRQRNANLAFSILKKCAALVTERKLIVDMLRLHCEASIKIATHDDGGIVINCEDTNTGFKFFESYWKIYFDCSNHYVVDVLDFSLTVRDRVFYNAAKAAMNTLVNPNVLYKNKVNLWWDIMQAVNKAVQEDVAVVRTLEPRDFLSVTSNQNLNSEIKCEILESDDEDCIVIED